MTKLIDEIENLEEFVAHHEFNYTGYPQSFQTERAIQDRVIFYLKAGIKHKDLLERVNRKEEER